MSFLPKSIKTRRRLLVFAIAAPLLIAAVALSLYALKGTMVYFYTPAQLLEADVAVGKTIRLGGLVKPGTFERLSDGSVRFILQDKLEGIEVVYSGDLPDLFREGQGAVCEGELVGPRRLKARQILAKHDETYMPKNVQKALQEQGEWRPDAAMTPSSSPQLPAGMASSEAGR